MNPLGLVKAAADLIVSMGVGVVVGNVIKTTTPATLNLAQKIGVGVGSFVLCHMFGDMAARYTTQTIFESASEDKKDEDTTVVVNQDED